MRLLIAEDDYTLGEVLLEGLQKEKFNVNLVSDGEAAQTFIESGLYDMVILDIGLPIKTGLEVLKQVRAKGIKTPIICLTARDGLEDRIICTSELKLGWIWSFIPNLDQNDPNRKVLSALPVFPKGDGLIVCSPNFLFSSVCSPSFCLFLF